MFPFCPVPVLQRSVFLAALMGLALVVGCGGGGSNPPPGPPVAVAPAISTQPSSLTVSAPQPASFSVTASGTAPLHYQWTKGGANVGTDAATFSLAGTVAADAGSYTVTVSNAAGSVTSTAALLTVNPAPVAPAFTTQPANLSLTVGQNGQFVVAVSGSPAPTLDWQVSVNNGPWFSFGVTTPIYDVFGPTLADSGRQYRAVASNSAGTVNSNTATLTVNAPVGAPAFTTQPVSQSVTAPAAATFTTAVSGSPTPTLQWQRSNDSGVTWTDLVGATLSTYTTAATTGADTGSRFRVRATNSAGTLNSNAATLTVASLGKTWQAAALVSPSIPGGILETPQIAFDAQGNAMAIWIHNDAGVARYDLWANRYVAGTGWGTAQIIFPGVGTRVNRPQLGMDATGKALVVWNLAVDPYNPLPHIMSIRFDPATGWGTASGIDNDTAALNSDSPKLAVAANGSAVAVWQQGDSLTVLNVCILKGSTSTGWVGTPAVLATGPLAKAGQVGVPDVLLNAQGVGFLFWQYFDGTNYLLTAAPFAAGVAGAGQIVATAAAFYNPHGAINAAGTAVVIWGQFSGTRLGVVANRYLPASGWGAPAQVNALGWTAFNQTPDPQITLDDGGTATALWIEGTGAASPKVWNHQTAAGWGVPEIITYSLGEYRLAGNGAGQLLGARFSGANLYASPAYLVTTADWGAGSLLSSTGIIPLNLKMDANGNGLATWLQPVTGGYALWGSLYR